MRKRKIFRVASGQALRAGEGKNSRGWCRAECGGRKAEGGREETEREYESGQELLRQRVYEGPGGRDAEQKGARSVHVARFRKEESVILLCVTRITRVSLRKIRSIGRSNVTTLMRFLFASPLNFSSYMTTSVTPNPYRSVQNDAAGLSPPVASAQRLLCHNGKVR